MTDSGNPQVDITALAALAKLDVSAEELAKLEQEIPDILGFVTTIQEASADAPKIESAMRNIMREDGEPIEGGTYTEKILSAAPAREGNHFSVKKVISRK